MVCRRAFWFKHRINGAFWRIYLADPKHDKDLWLDTQECAGVCLFDSRQIIISVASPKSQWVGTLLHEIAHAQCPDLPESTIVDLEHLLMETLLPHWHPPRIPILALRLVRRVRRRKRRKLKS